MLHDLWALLLILSPVEIPVGESASPEAWQSLKSLALTMELVGPHENWVTSYRSEVSYCRHYARALINAPRIADADLLPSAEYAADAAQFAAERAAWLDWQQFAAPHRADAIAPLLCAAKHRSLFWADVVRARSQTGSWPSRRTALERIREAMGVEAYYSGAWPAAVPIAGFREAD